MKPSLRHAAVAALSAAVAFGVAAPAATAAPASKPAHVKTVKANAAEKKAAAAAKKAAVEKRQVISDLDRRDAALARVVEGDRLAGLADEVVTGISDNVAADRSALAGIRSSVVAGGQDLREVRAQLRAYRVETYNLVVGIARDAVTVAAEASANDASLADLASSSVEVTDAQAANAAAVESANSALAKALLLTATSPVHSRADVEADMAAAFEYLVMVATFLEAQASEEPAVEEPAAGKPTETL